MTSAIPEPADARRLLDDITTLRRDARRAQGGHWFPLTLFGLLTLAVAIGGLGRHPSGLVFRAGPSVYTGLVWLIGVPAVYLASVAFYAWRAHRRGIGTTRTAYALAGVGLFVLFAVLAALPSMPGDAVVRGLTPLYPISAGFLLLAYVERSWPLAAYTIGLLGLSLLANLYDIENRVLTGQPAAFVNPLVVAVYLLAGGLGFGLAAWRSRP